MLLPDFIKPSCIFAVSPQKLVAGAKPSMGEVLLRWNQLALTRGCSRGSAVLALKRCLLDWRAALPSSPEQEWSLSRRNTHSLTPGCLWPHVSHSSGASLEGRVVAELDSRTGKKKTCRTREETIVHWLPLALHGLCCLLYFLLFVPSVPLREKASKKVILLILRFYTWPTTSLAIDLCSVIFFMSLLVE